MTPLAQGLLIAVIAAVCGTTFGAVIAHTFTRRDRLTDTAAAVITKLQGDLVEARTEHRLLNARVDDLGRDIEDMRRAREHDARRTETLTQEVAALGGIVESHERWHAAGAGFGPRPGG